MSSNVVRVSENLIEEAKDFAKATTASGIIMETVIYSFAYYKKFSKILKKEAEKNGTLSRPKGDALKVYHVNFPYKSKDILMYLCEKSVPASKKSLTLPCAVNACLEFFIQNRGNIICEFEDNGVISLIGNKYAPAMRNSFNAIIHNRKFNTVVDTFGGALGLSFLAEPHCRKKLIINVYDEIAMKRETDPNVPDKGIHNCYKVIKKEPLKLFSLIMSWVMSEPKLKGVFEKAKEIYSAEREKTTSLEYAACFLVLNKLSCYHDMSSFNKNISEGILLTLFGYINKTSKLLNIKKVKLKSMSSKQLISSRRTFLNDKDNLLIFDPPYLDVTDYGTNFPQKEHRLLLQLALNKGVNFVYCARTSSKRKVEKATNIIKKSPRELIKEDKQLRDKLKSFCKCKDKDKSLYRVEIPYKRAKFEQSVLNDSTLKYPADIRELGITYEVMITNIELTIQNLTKCRISILRNPIKKDTGQTLNVN